MKTKLLLFMAVLFSSCMTLDKAKQKMRDNPIALAEMCALHFPANDKFIKGDPVIEIREEVRTDTVTVELEGKTIKVACPECRQQTKTITVTDTIVRVDEASLFALLRQVNDLTVKNAVIKSDVARRKKENRNLIFWLIGSGIGLLGMVWFKLK